MGYLVFSIKCFFCCVGISLKNNQKTSNKLSFRKCWYILRSPGILGDYSVGMILIIRKNRMKYTYFDQKERILKVSLADIYQDEDQGSRVIKLGALNTKDDLCRTVWHEMDSTNGKIYELVVKGRTIFEVCSKCTTSDVKKVMVFVLGYTKKYKGNRSTSSFVFQMRYRDQLLQE